MGLTQDDERLYDVDDADRTTKCLMKSLESIGSFMSCSVPDAQAKAYLHMTGVDNDELVRAFLVNHHLHQLDEIVTASRQNDDEDRSCPETILHHAKSAPTHYLNDVMSSRDPRARPCKENIKRIVSDVHRVHGDSNLAKSTQPSPSSSSL